MSRVKELNIEGIDEVVYYDECDNGLKIYIWVNEKVSSTFMSLAVNYGSIHTEFIHNNKKIKVPYGTAHYLEHLKFNESDGVSAHDFFAKTGADINAFTTFDYTAYHVSCLDKVEENLNHLLDYVQTPYFTKELVNKERGIITEEEKMTRDNPNNVSYFGLLGNLFEKSNYRNLITGSNADIKKISLEDIDNVFDAFYHPSNMALFITGNVNQYELDLIIKQNQKLKKFDAYKKPTVIVPKEKSSVCSTCATTTSNVAFPKVKYGIKIPRSKLKKYSDSEVRLITSVILSMNFGSTSVFKDFLIVNNLANSIGASADIYDDYLIIVIAYETKYPDDVTKLVTEKLKDMSLDEDTFNRKMKAAIAKYIVSFDDIDTVNSNLQDEFINYGDILLDMYTKYSELTIDDIKDVLNIIDFKNSTVFTVLPKEN